MNHEGPLAVIRGGGDLGTGVALRLQRAGWRIVITELSQPLVIRRAVALASAVYEGAIELEGTIARYVERAGVLKDAPLLWTRGEIPVIVDPDRGVVSQLQPLAVIDAIMAKRNTGTQLTEAPIVVALGPGFTVGLDCQAVIETRRGHNLGRVYYQGTAEADTGIPGKVGGQDSQRVLRAPVPGTFTACTTIGQHVEAGAMIAQVNETPVITSIAGVVRGLLHDGLSIPTGMKVADVDPRDEARHCFTVSDKAWAVGGGVLEAVLYLQRS